MRLHALMATAGTLLAAQACVSLALPQEGRAEGPNRRSRKVANDPKITTQTSTRDLPVDDDQSGTGLALFLGAGGNFYSVSPTGAQSETGKSGPGFQGRMSLTLFTQDLALELGAGWLQSYVSGAPVTTTQANTSTTQSADLNTRAGFADFSPRLRFGEHFELGPSAGVLFGTNASFGITNSKPDSPILAGLRAAAAWQTRALHFRVVGQAQTSLTIPERRVIIGSLGLEIGIPLLRGKTIVRETETKQIEERVEVEYIETEVPVVEKVEVVKEVVREVLLFTFDDQVVHFEFDRAALTPASREFVGRLGQFLAENPGLWSNVRIDGHTDNRGTPDYNLRLSDARARTVLAALADAGVSADKLASRGLGLTAPLDRGPSDLAHARNRRVEMSFAGVSDAQALRDGINRIRFETAVPQTCRKGRCR